MKSILIVGLGRFGRHMAKKFLEQGDEVLAIEKNEERADSALSYARNVHIGDATNEDYMASLGIGNFDLCIVAIGDNFQAALETTVVMKDLGAQFIIARATRDVHKKLLLRNGADYVVYAEREMAERLAVKYGASNVFDFVELSPDYSIYEIATPSSWYGKTILEKDVRKKYQINILGFKRAGEIHMLPDTDYTFRPEDTLIIMGQNNHLKPLIKS
ncbi:potassium channel family protein [Ructibacterium gallinarum]|uniref:TrkA family potassium uptake protein n=1 Tax=Ructibacterium gallinarum TaxID=2779355 RepID=A0A9D5M223_9FIRM|nr:TrkA family potassium uptake protein [Ructibacterium gallinarum]MBE5041167.1 TrkA family potassium uptake protein [Ructibacterium gallinarum]